MVGASVRSPTIDVESEASADPVLALGYEPVSGAYIRYRSQT